MNERLALIRQRRELLLTRIAVQRLAVARAVDAWHGPLAMADTALATGRRLRRHPWIIAFAAALLLKAPQHQLALWVARGLTVWRLYRTFETEWPRGR